MRIINNKMLCNYCCD